MAVAVRSTQNRAPQRRDVTTCIATALAVVFLLVLGSCSNPWTQIRETETTAALKRKLQGPGRVMHGHYCGFGTIDGTLRQPPVDRLDEACRQHDICYTQGRHHCDCDHQLRSAVARIIADPATSPRIRRKARLVRSTFALPFCRLFPQGIMPPRDRKMLDDVQPTPF